MKRLSILVALLLLVAMPMMAEHVTPETARKVASTFLNNNDVKTTQLTDLSKAAGFSNLYIFNGEQGFVVMAADDCAQPILGYSLTGKFVAENMPTNVSGWLQGYNDEIQYAIDSKMKATTETTQLWKDLANGNSKVGKTTAVVDALIQTTWDQNPLYNALCPYDNTANELTVTGCAATAIAQIMRYWEYPTMGSYSHSYTHQTYGTQSANFGSTTYDWMNMPLSLSGSSSTSQIYAVATLMYHCGVALNMNYGLSSGDGSSAYPSDIPNALKTYFRYKTTVNLQLKRSYSENQWIQKLKDEIDNGRPIQYNGYGTGGHSFICDGYDSNNSFHFNWGWSGQNDGFYTLSNLTPGSGGAGGSNYSFTNDQNAIFGIEPQDCTAAMPTNFNVVKQERNAILSWDLANNAESYSIYRNSFLIDNTTSTTYTDSNLSYGTYAYYVKSKDTNGASSSPTEAITMAIEPVATNLTLTRDGNGAVLNWTEPEWCLPQTDDEVLTYGDGSLTGGFGSGTAGSLNIYFGHRYPASMLENNKVIYKVSFYATEAGAFQLFVYTATANNNKPQTLIHTQSVTASSTGWIDIDISEPIEIDPITDLWVFIYDPEAKSNPIGYNGTVVTDSNYCIWDPYDPTIGISAQNVLLLIRTYITDGSFTYNLYDNTTSIAQNLSGTSYSISGLSSDKAYCYTLKTNFNNGETAASNMAGLVLGSVSLSTLEMTSNDRMVLTSGSSLTVSGTLSNDNAANLIIEDGAQLVSSSDEVKATVHKTISPFTQNQNNGWHLIASPITEDITPSQDNGLFSNNYDLYTYDQSASLEWQNVETQSFFLNNRTGYLYANSGNPTVSFAGTLAANAVAAPLAYDANATHKGFNLIGNPYPCNAYIDRSFYVLNADGSEFTVGSNPIPPCTAVLVQAQSTGESVTFSKTAPDKETHLTLSIATDNVVLDKVRIGFDSNESLTKYIMHEGNTILYITQDDHNLAVASANGRNEMSVNFKAAHNGTYTLSIDAENMEIGYLHLVDNFTGADIDLSATSNYSFEAKTSDNAARFTLVFATASINTNKQTID